MDCRAAAGLAMTRDAGGSLVAAQAAMTETNDGIAAVVRIALAGSSKDYRVTARLLMTRSGHGQYRSAGKSVPQR